MGRTKGSKNRTQVDPLMKQVRYRHWLPEYVVAKLREEAQVRMLGSYKDLIAMIVIDYAKDKSFLHILDKSKTDL
jgi:hypothetical protein